MIKVFFSFSPYTKFTYAILLLALFFLPNLALVLGGFYGFYATYSALALLTALSLPLVARRRGLGSIDVYSSLSISLVLVFLYTVLGFVLGFVSRPRSDILSLSISLGLFLVQVLSTEVSRSLTLSLLRRRTVVVVLGVLIGLFIGRTMPAITNYISSLRGSTTLLSLFNDVAFNLTVTLIHVYGGFVAAAIFRLVVDGYWRFSPLTPNTSSLGIAWTATSVLIYYGLALYLLHRTPTLRELGRASKLKLRRASTKLRTYLPQIAAYAVALTILTSLYARVIPLVIVSGSMRPTLDIGDIALVRVGKPTNLSVGDIIAFRLNSTIVIHRVVGVKGEKLVTKGDANPEPDPFQVSRESLIGVVVGSIPKVGTLTLIIRGGIKLSGYFIVPVAVIISALLIGLARRRTCKQVNTFLF